VICRALILCLLVLTCFVPTWLVADATATPANEDPLAAEVEAVERAFARTMAERDLAAFATFVAEEAVFLGGAEPLRGKPAVVAAWSRYFETDAAPFSWAPGTVEALPSGTLALSTGPVHAPDGTLVATFTSIWRRDDDGVWRIVFDQGNEVCESDDR
jgi:ketosteroid isomerase-like protein